MSAYLPGRPLVVLAGWLGCQPRSLRRYEALYRDLGFGVLTRIAPPRMVLATLAQAPEPITLPLGWPRTKVGQETIQGLAWDTLRQVDASQCSSIVLHVFSNGGAVVWEQIRNILRQPEACIHDQEAVSKLGTMRTKVAGVVFDSSPSYFTPKDHGTVMAALQYCSWRDRIGAYAQLLRETVSIGLSERERRAQDYFEAMRSDPWDVRQLYLCSKDDPLAQHDRIVELARHRQTVFGQDRVFLREWESSPHCCHLLTHPVEYTEAISTFAEHCLYGEARISSL